jgi:hypothetical protein
MVNGKEWFRIYGDAVRRGNSIEALNRILTMMTCDAAWKAVWENNQLDHEARFLTRIIR